MMKHLRSLLAVAAVATFAQAASAAIVVLNFDDLAGPVTYDVNGDPVPSSIKTEFFGNSTPYQGFIFGDTTTSTIPGSWYYSNDSTGLPVGINAASSGDVSISTEQDGGLGSNAKDFGTSMSITKATPFTFVGANFKSFDNGITVQFQLLLNGVQQGVSAVTAIPLSNSPVFVSGGYIGPVNEIRVVSYHGFFAMDDFTYDTNPVPEPGTYGMMLAGLGALAFVARRRKQAGK